MACVAGVLVCFVSFGFRGCFSIFQFFQFSFSFFPENVGQWRKEFGVCVWCVVRAWVRLNLANMIFYNVGDGGGRGRVGELLA